MFSALARVLGALRAIGLRPSAAPRGSPWPVCSRRSARDGLFPQGLARKTGCSTLGFVQLIDVTWILVKF